MLKIRTLLVTFVLLLSGCVIIPTYKERLSIETIDSSKEAVSFNNVLVIGSGPVASRVFLDNLYTELSRSFEQKGIQSEFTYLGKIDKSHPPNLDSLTKTRFDAYMMFKASDSSILDMQKVKFVGYGAGIFVAGHGNQFYEHYTITFKVNRDNVGPAWRGVLNVDFDLANNFKYGRISSMICQELERTGIMNNK
jgi:hypothetical protein